MDFLQPVIWTLPAVMIYICWDDELISLAQTWTPREHVIFAADVKVTFDDYRKTMVSTATSKTIFTVNPDTQEAHQLYNYAQNVELCGADSATDYDNQTVDFDTVESVYCVSELKARQVNQDMSGTICAIVYAFPTMLNLDADVNSVVAVRCSDCHFRVDNISGKCVNQNCPQGSASMLSVTKTRRDTTFDMRVTVSDHTGSIQNCHLSGDVAESMLGCTVVEFLTFDEDQKTRLKWKFLLERCKIYIKITQPSFEQQKSIARILQCNVADPQQAACALRVQS